ncbi:MAG TPA: universal stress protein [Verrucomicrobiae bacterium]|jgi:universal stress protein family protein|nr:universal stress protein [Verrucomicrobiae bacterium]
MAKRILMVITPACAGDLVSAARSAAAVARESGGGVRMAWVRPLPAPRRDRHDRVVADADREMARLTAAALEEMAALAGELGEVDVERVVRFGRLATELLIETHAWRADLIGLAAPERPGPRHRVRAWYLGRMVSIPVVLLPIDRGDTEPRRRASVALPAFR